MLIPAEASWAITWRMAL